MIRLGTVLVFKEGVSTEEAAAALAQIAEVLDLPDTTYVYRDEFCPKRRRTVCRQSKRPHEIADEVREFDEALGGPVWYIP